MKNRDRLVLLGTLLTLGIALAALITTSHSPAHANSQPDLVVGRPSVDDARPSTQSVFKLSVTVTNGGAGESATTTLRYYQSTDSTISSSDFEEFYDSVGALASSGTSDKSVSLSAPSAPGTYYYGACVDAVAGESDTTNNCSSSVTVTVPEPEPDLIVIGPDVKPKSVETGGQFRLLVTVTNQGDGQSAATTLRYKRSTDATITTSDTSVGMEAIRALTRPQANGESIRLTAPTTPGTYYYGACVDTVAGESNTSNNCSSSVAVTVQASTDASLSALTLSNIDFGTFSSGTTSYTAEVTNIPAQTTVSPTVNHSAARYVIKIGGVTDADGTVSLAVGSNVITIEVTAQDDQTTRTYTVTVTRLITSQQNQASTDATLRALTLSSVNIGAFASGTTSYAASVSYSVSETTVTPTANHSGASYVIKIGGVTDADRTISLAVGSNVITIEVTAQDDQTTRTYTVTVTRLATSQQNQASTDATLRALTLSSVNIGTFASSAESYAGSVAYTISKVSVSPTVSHSGARYVIKIGGVTDTDGTVSLAVGSNIITVEVTAEDGSTTKTYTVTVTRASPSTDASLSALRLSNIDFGTFTSGTTSYVASVTYSVSETTVTPTANHSRASYVVKLDGETDADRTISLSVGSNVITVEVTAEDSTTMTYTVTVTRAEETVDSFALIKAVVNDAYEIEALTDELSDQLADLLMEYLIEPVTGETSGEIETRLSAENSFDLLVAVLNDAYEKEALSNAVSTALADMFMEYLIVPVTGETLDEVEIRLSA